MPKRLATSTPDNLCSHRNFAFQSQLSLFDEANDFEFLGCPISHVSDSRIADHIFLSSRFSSSTSASNSFKCSASARSPFNFIAFRFTRGVAGQPFLARLQKPLGPTIIDILVDPFLAAQLGDAVHAAQACDHDPELFLSAILPSGCASNIANDLFGFLRLPLHGWFHRSSSVVTMNSNQSLDFCLTVLTGNSDTICANRS
jgi:hypothetical protein